MASVHQVHARVWRDVGVDEIGQRAHAGMVAGRQPAGHPDCGMYQANLGTAVQALFEHTWDAAALDGTGRRATEAASKTAAPVLGASRRF